MLLSFSSSLSSSFSSLPLSSLGFGSCVLTLSFSCSFLLFLLFGAHFFCSSVLFRAKTTRQVSTFGVWELRHWRWRRENLLTWNLLLLGFVFVLWYAFSEIFLLFLFSRFLFSSCSCLSSFSSSLLAPFFLFCATRSLFCVKKMRFFPWLFFIFAFFVCNCSFFSFFFLWLTAPFPLSLPFQALFLIATNGSPGLKEPEKWSDIFKDFLQACTHTDPAQRPSADDLLKVCWCRSSLLPPTSVLASSPFPKIPCTLSSLSFFILFVYPFLLLFPSPAFSSTPSSKWLHRWKILSLSLRKRKKLYTNNKYKTTEVATVETMRIASELSLSFFLKCWLVAFAIVFCLCRSPLSSFFSFFLSFLLQPFLPFCCSFLLCVLCFLCICKPKWK